MDALERAIAILKRQAFDRKQGGALLQVTKLARVPQQVKQTIFAFLNTDDEQDPLAVSAPQANAYEFQCPRAKGGSESAGDARSTPD